MSNAKFWYTFAQKNASDDDMPQFLKKEPNHQVQQAENVLNAEQSVVYKKVIWSAENNLENFFCINACQDFLD